MSKKLISLPYFREKNSSISYLGQYEYLDLSSSKLSPGLKERIFTDEGIFVQKRALTKTDKRSERLLVIEPHPDDFALSASGYVLSCLSQGASCTVLNIFSRTSIEKFPWRDKVKISESQLESLRLQESRIAVEEYLGENFESYRLPLSALRVNRKTFVTKHNEEELVDELAARLSKKINDEHFDIILCPLAIQGHVDHLVTFDALIKVYKSLDSKIEFIFYEDFPYSKNKKAYYSRLDTIQKIVAIEAFYVSVDRYLDIMADLVIIYRSQFDDINRNQMLAIIRENLRTTSASYNKNPQKGQSKLMQRYFKATAIL